MSANSSEAKKKLAMGGGGASAGGGRRRAQVDGVKLLARAVSGIELKDLRSLADEGKKQVGSGVVAIVATPRTARPALWSASPPTSPSALTPSIWSEGRRSARRQRRRRPARHGAGRRAGRLQGRSRAGSDRGRARRLKSADYPAQGGVSVVRRVMRSETMHGPGAFHQPGCAQVVPDGPLQRRRRARSAMRSTRCSQRTAARARLCRSTSGARLRKHVCIFVDGGAAAAAGGARPSYSPDSKLYVMQALSGG